MAYVPTTTVLEVGQQIGLAFVVEVASASFVATSGVLFYLLYLSTSRAGRRVLAGSHLYVYMTSLFASDVIQAIGGIMDALWVHRGAVFEGPYCTAQGAMKQAGDVGVAFAILAITVHTFCELFYGWEAPESLLLPLCVVSAIWTFVGLAVGLGYGLHQRQDYYGDTALWCWITSKHHRPEQLGLEYAWLWLTVAVNLATFAALAFSQCCCARRHGTKFFSTIAGRVVWFPLVYFITVVPTSVCRWIQFTTNETPWRATVVSAVLFSSSGFLNVVLFTRARAGLFEFGSSGTALLAAPATARLAASAPMHEFYPVGSTFYDNNTVSTARGARAMPASGERSSWIGGSHIPAAQPDHWAPGWDEGPSR